MLSLYNPMFDLLGDERRFGGQRDRYVPAVDVLEQSDHFMLKAEVPGIAPEDIDISIEGNLLTLKGEHKREDETSGEGYRRFERRYGAFQRSFTLPDTVDPEAIDAHCGQGVLTIRIPKQRASAARKIQVKAGEVVDKAMSALHGRSSEKGERSAQQPRIRHN